MELHEPGYQDARTLGPVKFQPIGNVLIVNGVPVHFSNEKIEIPEYGNNVDIKVKQVYIME